MEAEDLLRRQFSRASMSLFNRELALTPGKEKMAKLRNMVKK